MSLAEIAESTEITVQCAVAVELPDECDHEPETITLEEPAYLDDRDKIHLPGWFPECPVCGNPHEFEIDGNRVFWQ